MRMKPLYILRPFLLFAFLECLPTLSLAQDPYSEVRKASKSIITAFNAGKASDLAALFMSQGELVDEQGNLIQGQAAVKNLLDQYFSKFPGAKSETAIDSIRVLGPVAIEEGIRTTVTKDGALAEVQYTTIYSKTDAGWRVASIRDVAIVPESSPGEMLQSLEWIVGEWVNEGTDARVQLSYKWSEDGNFILGEISIAKEDQTIMKSSQRIGWDPITGNPRSWMFDSDGGFAETAWTPIGESWSLRSHAVMPNGETGTANVLISVGENGRYVMKGTNRIIGNQVEDDYEITIVKQPPAASK